MLLKKSVTADGELAGAEQAIHDGHMGFTFPEDDVASLSKQLDAY
jgi:hypothetical protein